MEFEKGDVVYCEKAELLAIITASEIKDRIEYCALKCNIDKSIVLPSYVLTLISKGDFIEELSLTTTFIQFYP